jgi:hypothetical protein
MNGMTKQLHTSFYNSLSPNAIIATRTTSRNEYANYLKDLLQKGTLQKSQSHTDHFSRLFDASLRFETMAALSKIRKFIIHPFTRENDPHHKPSGTFQVAKPHCSRTFRSCGRYGGKFDFAAT